LTPTKRVKEIERYP